MKSPKIFLIEVCFFVACYNGAIYCQPQVSLSAVAAMTDTSQLRQIVSNYRGQEIAAFAQNRIGEILYAERQYDAAEKEFLSTHDQYLGQFPERARAAYFLGKIYFYKQDLSKAKNYLAEYTASKPPGAEADWGNYYLVRTKFWCGDPDYVSSVRAYLGSAHPAALSHDPTMHYDLVRYLMDNHKYQDAVSETQTMASKFPNDTMTLDAKFKMGEAYGYLNRPKDAVDVFNSIINSSTSASNSARAYYELAMAYDYQNDYVDAEKDYGLVSSQFPNETVWTTVSQYFFAMMLRRESLAKPDSAQLSQKAFDALNGFITDHPRDIHIPRVLMALADLYAGKGEYHEACAAYDQIIAFDTSLVSLKHKGLERSNDIEAHAKLVLQARLSKGNVLLDKIQNPDSALAEYQKLAAADSGNTHVQLKEGMCYMRMGQGDKARQIFNALITSGSREKDAALALLQSISSDSTVTGGK